METRRCLGKYWPVLGLPLLFAASGAQAEGRESSGRTSTGSLGIALTILPHAQINGPGTIHLGRREDDSRATQRVCLSSNSPTGSYMIGAIGSGQDGAFELVNGSGRIGYTVEWTSRDESVPGPLIPNESRPAKAAANEAECASGSAAADLAVAIDPAQVHALRSGAPYTGTLILVVTPY